MRLGELAAQLQVEWRGVETAMITGVSSLDDPQPGTVTLVADPTRAAAAAQTGVAALIVPGQLAGHEALTGCNLLLSANPKLTFARAIQLFTIKPYVARGLSPDLVLGEASTVGAACSIHPRVTIGRNSTIGDRVTLHPGVVIGDGCRIGADTVIFANVSVYDDCEIGARCRIHSGVVIGADGFSFTPDEQGRQCKLPQIGRVVIEDDVEIGANCCVDRAGFGETRLRRGAKFDNLIQLGHNVEIGEDTVVASLCGFSGGAKVGKSCIIAGQIGTNPHVTIGDHSIITARTGVTKSVKGGKMWAGVPIRDYLEWRKAQVLITRLPELFERLKTLEKAQPEKD
jgi:UDP-3-O-[3-hydroxymyristoyl] glucosamine N-acyltransferase